MATYLLVLSVGPVQSLIDAARRTRDLWSGSWLLGEATKAAALALHEARPGCLVFPSFDDPATALAPLNEPDDDAANIANVLRAEISADSDTDVRAAADGAKTAARRRLADLCESARKKAGGLKLDEPLWKKQVDDILEIYAAWTIVSASGYGKAAKRARELLASRKTTRDYMPAAKAPDEELTFGKRKSSLDAGRESVIGLSRDDRKTAAGRKLLRRLRIGEREELDVLALTKRLGGKAEQFTAYARIAADPWIRTLPKADQEKLANAYEPLIGLDLATRTSAGTYAQLPYDAALLYDFRRANALADIGQDERGAVESALNTLHEAQAKLGKPVPYAAILKADGDRMSELLGHADSAARSRVISQSLHGFARQVRGIVRRRQGHAIYAGGDDVLALLPLDGAVWCAAELADAFRAAMAPHAKALGVAEERQPSLSVGIGIGHLMEPLGRLRRRADEAEKHAKGDNTDAPRNALAIHLGVRSGVTIEWRSHWNERGGGAAECPGIDALKTLTKAYGENQCPSRLGYALRAIAQRLSWVETDNEPLPGIHAAELVRTLDLSRQRGGDGELSKSLRTFVEKRAAAIGLARLGDELIVARWLSARMASDLGAIE